MVLIAVVVPQQLCGLQTSCILFTKLTVIYYIWCGGFASPHQNPAFAIYLSVPWNAGQCFVAIT